MFQEKNVNQIFKEKVEILEKARMLRKKSQYILMRTIKQKLVLKTVRSLLTE